MRLRVVGLGMGPHQLTREAESALREVDYVVAFRKGADDALHEVRRAVCTEFGLDLVEITDPERDRNDPADYARAVADWHDARALALGQVLTSRAQQTAAILVWGDPSLYDSTLRLIERVTNTRDLSRLAWDVVPGIATPQILAARHRIVLHPVGAPVHITTARRLRADLEAGQQNLVVMLGGVPDLSDLPRIADWSIWWGANLGAPGEQLLSGVVGEVNELLARAKKQARAIDGWVMDAYLLRAPQPPSLGEVRAQRPPSLGEVRAQRASNQDLP